MRIYVCEQHGKPFGRPGQSCPGCEEERGTFVVVSAPSKNAVNYYVAFSYGSASPRPTLLTQCAFGTIEAAQSAVNHRNGVPS